VKEHDRRSRRSRLRRAGVGDLELAAARQLEDPAAVDGE
jgi:hypothetical protein